MMWVVGFGILFLLLAAGYLVWGIVEAILLWRANRAPVQAEGRICGMVYHRPLLRYERDGKVPQPAFQYWGRTTGHGAHGFLSIAQSFSRWHSYPCVEFTSGGKTVAWLYKKGAKEEEWSLGQPVKLRYFPGHPEEYFLDGDQAARHSVYMNFVWAVLFAALGAALVLQYL